MLHQRIECILENLATICLPNIYSKPVLHWSTILIKSLKLFGSRSVPTLATLLYLSYAKFLCTINIIASLQLASLRNAYVEGSMIKGNTVTMVCGLDDSLTYGHYPHIFLLFAALMFLVLFWIPCTLL